LNSTTRRIALITGANKGIGLEIARQLAQQGIYVLIGARSAERGSAAAKELVSQGLDVAFVRLDVTDAQSIAAAVSTVAAEHGRLDILVNNAGIADRDDGAPSSTSLDVVRRTFETNFFGALAVTQAMLPLLRKSAAGRIVNLSSALGSLTTNSDPSSPFSQSRLIGYNSSKAALNMLTVQLSAELRDTKIAVNSVSPGFVKTDLTRNTGRLSPAEAAVTPVQFALLADDNVSGKFVNVNGELPW
jgi:NAD(P)-dependent dehydrogenase (short-subunit alcohol dehydrogenase family)